ncbi:condensation domain-containing protein [Paenibacillus sp. FSL P2-0136]|uniref:condensation domain-containing protein n=1 Tax=Paenibacillus sp. FSL P2-0136 TaxID=2975317 RepID=UPI0030DBADFA
MKKLRRDNVEDIVPLTPMQKGMLIHHLKQPASYIYFEQMCLEVTGDLRIHLFEQAWQKVAAINEMLRTTFRWELIENPVQIILKEAPPVIEYVDLAQDGEAPLHAVEKLLSEDRLRRVELTDVPFRILVCKTQEQRYLVILNNHHILYDGWSTGILLKEFFEIYNELYHGRTPGSPWKNKYKAFVSSLNKRNIQAEHDYWRTYLQGFRKEMKAAEQLPQPKPESEKTIKNVLIPASTFDLEEIRAFLKKHQITLAVLMYTAWGILLHKYYAGQDIVFGTTVSGRKPHVQQVEDMVGLFINTLPLRMNTAPNLKVIDLLKQVMQMLQEREEFEYVSLADLKKYAGSGSNLFDTMVVLENYPVDNAAICGNDALRVTSYSMLIQAEYDLVFNISVLDGIELTLSYNSNRYTQTEIENMGVHLNRVLQHIMSASTENELKLSQIELMEAGEMDSLITALNRDRLQLQVEFDI